MGITPVDNSPAPSGEPGPGRPAARPARSSRWPCPPSRRWSRSRCCCSPTRRSSATSAPTPLAGLGIAANVLGVLIGLCIFLAYGTTGTVARRLGAGDRAAALRGGLRRPGAGRAVWVSLLGLVLLLAAPAVVGAYGASPAVTARGHHLPAGRGVRPAVGAGAARRHRGAPRAAGHADAAAGGHRGERRQRRAEPDAGLRRGAGHRRLGAGDAAGPDRGGRGGRRRRRAPACAAVHAHPRFAPAGVLRAARAGSWLVLRTATLQGAITLTTLVAATSGTVALAAHQVVTSLWVLLAFALDALAIAGQAIIGRALGGGRRRSRPRDDPPDGRLGRRRRAGLRAGGLADQAAVRRLLLPRPAGAAAGRGGAAGRRGGHPRSPVSSTSSTGC